MEVDEPVSESKKTKMSLLDLSHEILQDIFSDVGPLDLAALSRSCKSLNAFVQGNQLLYKALYLQRWVSCSILRTLHFTLCNVSLMEDRTILRDPRHRNGIELYDRLSHCRKSSSRATTASRSYDLSRDGET